MVLVVLHTDGINILKGIVTNFDRESLLDCSTYVNVIYNQSICPILSTRKSKKRISKGEIMFAR